MADLGARVVLGILMIILMAGAAVFNIFVVFTFARLKKLRKAPEHYFIMCMTVADLTSALLWCLPTLIAVSVPGWVLGTFMCSLTGTLWAFCFVVNMHSMAILAFERCLRICRPSKHEIVFKKITTLILLGGMLVLDLVMALFPAMGWGVLSYFPSQFHCVPKFEKSVSHLNFMFVFSYLLPIIWTLICFGFILHKVRKLKSRVAPGKEMVLEENTDIPKESYAEKLQKQQRKFQHAPLKKKKPVIGKKKKSAQSDDGYVSESSSSDDSDEAGKASEYEASGLPEDHSKSKPAKKRKRVHKFKQEEFTKAVTIMIAWLAYVACWFPFHIASYVWTYAPAATSEGGLIFVAWVSHLGLIVKVIVYGVHNKHYRACFLEALGRKKKTCVEDIKDPEGEPDQHDVNKDKDSLQEDMSIWGSQNFDYGTYA